MKALKAFLRSTIHYTIEVPGAFIAATAGTLLGLKFILIPLLKWVTP